MLQRKLVTMERPADNSPFAHAIHLLDTLQRVYMRAISYVKPVADTKTFFGSTVRCSSRDFIQRRIRFFKVYEHNLTHYTIGHLREGDVYVDIGANIGYFSLLASRYVGSLGKVISVEADPVTFATLAKNLELNGCQNVVARNVAATATVCKVTIQPGDARNSGTKAIMTGASTGNVDGLPFRDIVGEDLGRVRFIKIDIEGSETPILDAILEALPELPPGLIIASEVSPASATHVERFLRAGFRAYVIPNVYSIDYYLIRQYLTKFGEGSAANLFPTDRYDPEHSDYVFERTLSPELV